MTRQSPQRLFFPSHLAALRNKDVEIRHVFAAAARLGSLHLADDVHAVRDASKDDVFPVEEGRGHGGDEELRAVCIGASILVVPN